MEVASDDAGTGGSGGGGVDCGGVAVVVTTGATTGAPAAPFAVLGSGAADVASDVAVSFASARIEGLGDSETAAMSEGAEPNESTTTSTVSTGVALGR